ncbi:MAG: amidohydrolase [Chloroflexota bacterium]
MSADTHADLIITGRVATLGGDAGFGWQGGLAIADGRVLAVGDESALDPLAGPGTRRWRLADDLVVMPGITDAHLHLMTLVLAEQQIDLTGTDLDTALAAVGSRHREMLAAGDGEGWLLGHGWSLHELGGWPDTQMLESVAPHRPIALYSHDHHTRWVSRRALAVAGISSSSVDPDGGLIRRDGEGAPTGILHEVASALVDSAIPSPTTEDLTAAMERVAAHLAGLGLTGCHDPGELTADSAIERGPLFYRSLAARGRLPLRVHSSVRAPQLDRAIELGLFSGQGTPPEVDGDRMLADRAARYRMGWLKLFADGSLGSRSAALLAPYEDAETNPPTGGPTGMILTEARELAELLGRAAAAGISGQVHAIGDAAVRSVLDVFAAAPVSTRLMRRIEHAQLVDPADMTRFGELGVAASLQPVHLRSDAVPARVAWGLRTENTFPLRALVEGGALIPLGTDAPVEPADPWPGIAVAVARRDPFRVDDQVTGAHHAVSLARAVRAACLDPAIVADEPLLGRLISGYRADLLVVPAESFREPFDAAAFARIRPLATMIDGEVVHRSDAFEG